VDFPTHSIPLNSGIGLRAVHYSELLKSLPSIGWLEAHSENYFGEGGRALHYLEQLRSHYPLSLHGVGLGIGSSDPLNKQHLKKLKNIVKRFEPNLVSEHLCWNASEGMYLNDLLPLPYTEEALNHTVSRIQQVQEYLGREILIENVSSYLEYKCSTIPEWEFVTAIARQSGCKILLDINNIYVNAQNHDFDPYEYLRAIPADKVAEIHLAGFEMREDILVDTHSRPVCDAVWTLYADTMATMGPRPTLIEWDNDIPSLTHLLAEATKANHILSIDAQNATTQ
jgi:uncharacterized protein (UPF0276 family)